MEKEEQKQEVVEVEEEESKRKNGETDSLPTLFISSVQPGLMSAAGGTRGRL